MDTDKADEKLTSKNSLAERRYFPTQIFSFNIDKNAAEGINSEVIKNIRYERSKDAKGLNKSNTPSLGGWHSKGTLHTEDSYSVITATIETLLAEVSRINMYHDDYSLKISSMWSIINPPRSYNTSHIHPGSIFSGVYYVQVPNNAGDIEFTDPRTSQTMQDIKYSTKGSRPQACWTKTVFKPTAGQILIFPSWLYHSVTPNLSDQAGNDAERIIISFNANQFKKIM